MFSGIWKIVRETQQVIRRHMKESTQSPDIRNAGFIPIIFDIGNFSLCHIDRISQFRLVYFLFFPEYPDLLS